MEFNPLGNFVPNAPIDANVRHKAQLFYAQLPDVLLGLLRRIYLHWTVAGLQVCFADYNAEKLLVAGEHVLKITHDPRDNAPGLNDNAEAAHTIARNTGALGIAITGMDGANEHDFGPDPVTVAGLELLCAGAAALALKYGIDANGTVPSPGSSHTLTEDIVDADHQDEIGRVIDTTGEHNILTHAEAAVIDCYPADRIDLGSLAPLPDGVEMTPEMRTQCGDALRTRIHLYKLALRA